MGREPPILVEKRFIRTSNPMERRFVLEASKHGWDVYKRGWPDFLLVRGDEVVGVEVKPIREGSSSSAILHSKPQKEMRDVFEGKLGVPYLVSDGGILPEVLRGDFGKGGDKRVEKYWREFLEREKKEEVTEGDSRAEAYWRGYLRRERKRKLLEEARKAEKRWEDVRKRGKA